MLKDYNKIDFITFIIYFCSIKYVKFIKKIYHDENKEV